MNLLQVEDLDFLLDEELPELNHEMVENFFRPIQQDEEFENDSDLGYESDDENKYTEEREAPLIAPPVPIIEQNWHRLRDDERMLDPELLTILIEMMLEAERLGDNVFEEVYEGDF